MEIDLSTGQAIVIALIVVILFATDLAAAK